MKRCGRILRLRVGPLANFSGGAGYMPFVGFLSLPISLLYTLAGHAVLYWKARCLMGKTQGSERRVPLHQFVSYAYRHLIVCGAVAIATGAALFAFGSSALYGSVVRYAPLTFLFACGPLVAWIVSTWALMRLVAAYELRARLLLIAAAIDIVILAVAFGLAIALSSIL